jgi:lipid-A-disaccharide synthase-like uncharacterized protein
MVEAGVILLFIGWLGAILLGASWVPETIHTIKRRESEVEPSFLVLYFFADLCLTIYAAWLNDLVFLTLNAFVLFNVVINMYYEFIVERRRKKKH